MSSRTQHRIANFTLHWTGSSRFQFGFDRDATGGCYRPVSFALPNDPEPPSISVDTFLGAGVTLSGDPSLLSAYPVYDRVYGITCHKPKKHFVGA